MLMLYADGLVDVPEREHIEVMLAEDDELRSRLRVFTRTGQELGDLLKDHAYTPVPQRLRDCILETSPEPSGFASIARDVGQFFSFQREKLRFAGNWGLQSSVAAVVMMIVGVGVGWLLRVDGTTNLTGWENLIRFERNRLVAQGWLEQTLEYAFSGEIPNVTLPDERQNGMSIKMTFRNEAGDYCRQYEMAVPTSRSYIGVACRKGGEWIINLQAMTAPSKSHTNRIVPTSGNNKLAMDAAISALVFGAPLTDEEETVVIHKRWN